VDPGSRQDDASNQKWSFGSDFEENGRSAGD
jgi:hypothetical protein